MYFDNIFCVTISYCINEIFFSVQQFNTTHSSTMLASLKYLVLNIKLIEKKIFVKFAS